MQHAYIDNYASTGLNNVCSEHNAVLIKECEHETLAHRAVIMLYRMTWACNRASMARARVPMRGRMRD